MQFHLLYKLVKKIMGSGGGKPPLNWNEIFQLALIEIYEIISIQLIKIKLIFLCFQINIMAEASAHSIENLQIDALICLNGNSISITHTHLNREQMAELSPTGADTVHIISSLSKAKNDIGFINDLIYPGMCRKGKMWGGGVQEIFFRI